MSRILFISPYFAPAWGYGGPPRINYDLARFLVGRGHKVTVATTDVLNERERCPVLRERIDGITVQRFRNVSNWLAWHGKLFFPRGFRAWLSQHIAEFDFVFLSDFRDYQNAVAAPLCRTHRIPYALAAYGSLPRTGGVRGPIKALYDCFWGRAMVREARYLLGQTDHEREVYTQFEGTREQTVLLPLGIDAEQFRRRGGATFRKRHGIAPDETMLLFVGRINPLKGIDFLVRALAELRKTHKKLKLVIVGPDAGYYQKRLERLIDELGVRDQIVLTGPLYGKDNTPAYSAADLFVFAPSHYEETSLACLTALSHGTPVVTTKQASIPFLEQYQAGYEVERRLPMFVHALEKVLARPSDLRQMGKNGQRLIREVFDLSNVGARLEQLIAEGVHEKKG
ncbi:glycosyltransferase [Candidatus Berkelbacteria bacterium]|nr:glycosyltransferase [Candidatus Berkelbacteria bacterium]